MKFIVLYLIIILNPLFTLAEKIGFMLYDGIIKAGNIDNGAYLNFTGPNINSTYKYSKLIFGMLPSLRFKTDNKVSKNTFITPNLGFGITYCSKILSFQIPLYYNSKTFIENEKWHIGFGIGIRLNSFNKKN